MFPYITIFINIYVSIHLHVQNIYACELVCFPQPQIFRHACFMPNVCCEIYGNISCKMHAVEDLQVSCFNWISEREAVTP